MPTTTGLVKYKTGKLYELLISELIPDPKQPRKTMDQAALTEMIASIRALGVLEPIIFRQDEALQKIIVAGERRVEAARQAGYETIPGIFVKGDYAAIALIENLVREDLTPIEEAEGLQALMTEKEYSQEQLGAIFGKAQNTMSETLSLMKLPQELRDDCRGDRTITRKILVNLARKKNAEAMNNAYQAHKVKLQKRKPRPRKNDPNDPQSLSATLEKAATKIEALDTSAWTVDDKNNFQAILTRLKVGIENYLAKAPLA